MQNEDQEIIIIRKEVKKVNGGIVSNNHDVDSMIAYLKTLVDNYNYDQKYNYARSLDADTPEDCFCAAINNRTVRKVKLYKNKTLFTYDYNVEEQQLTYCELMKQNQKLFPQYDLALRLGLLFNYDLYQKKYATMFSPDYIEMLSWHGIKPKKYYYYFDRLREKYELNGTSNRQLVKNLQLIQSTLFPNKSLIRFASSDIARISGITPYVQQAEPVLNGILTILAYDLGEREKPSEPPDRFKNTNPRWCKFNQDYYCNKFKVPCHTSVHCKYYRSNR